MNQNISPPAPLDSALVLLRTPSYRCARDAIDQPSFSALGIYATDKAPPGSVILFPSPWRHPGMLEICLRSPRRMGKYRVSSYDAIQALPPQTGFTELYAPPMHHHGQFLTMPSRLYWARRLYRTRISLPPTQSSDFFPLEEWDRGRGVEGLEVERPSPAASIGLAFSRP